MECLGTIFDESKYADKVLEKQFKQNRKLGARDRKFIAECVYEIVRHYRYYTEVMGSNASLDLLAAHLVKTNGDLPNFEEFSEFSVAEIRTHFKKDYSPAIKHSFPEWMNALGIEEFGEADWNLLMAALNKPADVHLRTNTLKIGREQLLDILKSEDVPVVKSSTNPEGVTLTERRNVFTLEAFKKGYFEVQDISSQLVAPLVDPQPGQRVVDACAGAGGKSLHLAALMKNKGKIIAMDIFEWKLQELKKRAARDGVDIIETKVIDSSKVIKRLEGSFDRVLLDVPCSGMGVLRRNPDTKWKLKMSEIDRLVELQRELIVNYSKLSKPGGRMVYATCSILKRENENQVKWFLESEAGQKWELKEEMRRWPHLDGHDGFYAAVLQHKP